ncbi:MAG: hypothetical protein KTR25_14825 [Myxococcales bacterium]|nr:hypothetical protein [Myxococcales bacterium]
MSEPDDGNLSLPQRYTKYCSKRLLVVVSSMVLGVGCLEFRPGIELRVGLKSTDDQPEIDLGIQEVRLDPCEIRTSEVRYVPDITIWTAFRQWWLPSAWAHDDPGDLGGQATVIGEASELQLHPETSWLSWATVNPTRYCSVSLTLAPNSPAGYAFVVRGEDGHSVRLVEPMQIRYPIVPPALDSPGELSLVLTFPSEPIAEALANDELSGREMREVLRQTSLVDMQWYPRQGE